jgi:hypothetical protein
MPNSPALECIDCPDGPSDACEFCVHGQDHTVPTWAECYPDPWADDYAAIIADDARDVAPHTESD